MDISSSLETTAEISITFAGFVSLFMILARRDGSLASEVAVLIRFILLGSILSLFLAFLPLVAGGIGFAEAAIWRTTSSLGLIGGIGMTFFAVSQRRGLDVPQVTVFVRIAWVIGPLGLLVFLGNTVGWPLPPNGGVHLAGIWLILAMASVNLVDLVFRFALRQPAA
jgi:hypothetical protein